MKLARVTSPEWTAHVLAHFDAFLCDHAACERKASATAMSLVARYTDKPELVSEMIALAQEELAHFAQVWERMQARGLELQPDEKDEYVRQVLALSRKRPENAPRGQENTLRQGSDDKHLLDRLLVAGVVEARGCERFGLVAAALPPGELQDFYTRLTQAEARHHGTFARLARRYYPAEEVAARLQEMLAAEGEIVARLPLRAALH